MAEAKKEIIFLPNGRREMLLRADPFRDPVLLYRDAPETVRIFRLIIEYNTICRKLHSGYNNFQVKPEDMRKFKGAEDKAVNSLRNCIDFGKTILKSSLSKKPEEGKVAEEVKREQEPVSQDKKEEKQPEKKLEVKEDKEKKREKPKVKLKRIK